MTFNQTMSALKKMGTAQNRKIYARHGAGENMYGVSFANLNALKKQIRTDQALAEELWQTGNVDAMSLATMIADPQAFTARSADAWLTEIDYPPLTGLFAGVISRTKLAPAKIRKWTRARNEAMQVTGYSLLSATLKEAPAALADETVREFLDAIEQRIQDAPNRVRHAMNTALIAIGVYKPKLRKAALAAAGRIGKVEVDHGETSCKTPDAIAYINKTVAREQATGKPVGRVRRC